MPQNEKAPTKKWSDADETLALNYLKLSHTYPGTFAENKDRVARTMGYDGYKGLGPGVMAYIADKARRVKQKIRKERKEEAESSSERPAGGGDKEREESKGEERRTRS